MTAEKGTLSHYWNLASVEAQVRNDSCVELISALGTFQTQHEKEFGLPKEELKSIEDIKAATATDVSYALKRLLRGLSSSRDGARQGFSVALTEVPLFSKPFNPSC
jgi:DNA polymerase phi